MQHKRNKGDERTITIVTTISMEIMCHKSAPPSPVAVLDHDGFACRPDVRVHQSQVGLAAAAVELPGVETVVNQRVHVTLDLLLTLFGTELAVVRADAVVAICARTSTITDMAMLAPHTHTHTHAKTHHTVTYTSRRSTSGSARGQP